MTKKDILELKRRFTKNNCTFTRMCGCYIDADKNKIVDIGETFLNLEDEELYKYLEIAKKTLSGTVGNNLLSLEFPLEEEESGGKQQFLLGLRESRLKNPDLLDRLYDLIIENYDYAGNFLILIFHDAYDVITKTSDNGKLDESEEVFEYLLCAICPVTLTKPGLGYREDEHRIGPRIRDWVVGAPDAGFIFPAFSERSTDIHSTIFYTKDAKNPHAELMAGGLGCIPKRTATEQKQAFQSIVDTILPEEDDSNTLLKMDLQDNLYGMAEEFALTHEGDEEATLLLNQETLKNLMEESGVPEEKAAKFENSYIEEFGDTVPTVESLVDTKAVAANAELREKIELIQQVEHLRQQLDDNPVDDVKTYDVVLRVKPEKVSQISSRVIEGKKCLVIPMEENEHAAVNGVNTTV